MSTEERLKEFILNRYNSVSEFTRSIEMPNSTLESIFKRGIGNSSVTNVIKVCKALGISADALADGEIVPLKTRPTKRVNDWIEVEDILEDTKDMLTHSGFITLDGKPITVNGIDSIIDAMDVGVEIAKKKTKSITQS